MRKPLGDQSAAVLEWVVATVPGFALFRSRTDGVLLSVSDTWPSVTGLSPERCIGRPLIDLVHADDRARVERRLGRDAGAAPRAEIESRITEPPGRDRHRVAVRGPDLSGGGGRDLVGMLRDISADKAIERHLAAAYSYDTLTSIPNRALFMDRLGEAVRTARISGEGVALLVCDIDRFRAVNDTAGQRTADELLRVVGGALPGGVVDRSEEHTSELQSLMRISYAVFCLQKKNTK